MTTNTNKEIKNVYAKLQEARVLIQNDRMDTEFSTNSMFTMDRMYNIMRVSDGKVSSGVSRQGDNNGHNPNIFKTFKPFPKRNYGPVLPCRERGHQLAAGNVV